jgi:hypothetical protein
MIQPPDVRGCQRPFALGTALVSCLAQAPPKVNETPDAQSIPDSGKRCFACSGASAFLEFRCLSTARRYSRVRCFERTSVDHRIAGAFTLAGGGSQKIASLASRCRHLLLARLGFTGNSGRDARRLRQPNQCSAERGAAAGGLVRN